MNITKVNKLIKKCHIVSYPIRIHGAGDREFWNLLSSSAPHCRSFICMNVSSNVVSGSSLVFFFPEDGGDGTIELERHTECLNKHIIYV